MAWKLKRTAQCEHCPWLVTTNPRDIPNGYSVEKHAALRRTIAGPPAEQLAQLGREMHVMACHEDHESHCVGWLNHQLGAGNNIALRLAMSDCDNVHRLRLRGEQHADFEDTLP